MSYYTLMDKADAFVETDLWYTIQAWLVGICMLLALIALIKHLMELDRE